MAKWSIGLFEFMVIAVCWGPLVHCERADGGDGDGGKGQQQDIAVTAAADSAAVTCTGRCNFDWDYVYVASIITLCLQLFKLTPPNGGKE